MSIEKMLNKVPAGFLTILLVSLGTAAYFFMPVRMLPNLTPNTYLVEVSSPGLTPEEFDKLIASELEQGLLVLPCRQGLESQIYASTAQFRFVIKDDCQESREALKGRILETIDAKKSNWPAYTELTQSKFLAQEERWEYLIEGADAKDPAIRPWLKKLAADLRTLKGVKEVDVAIAEPKLDIDLNPAAMQSLGIEAARVADILRPQLRDSIVGVSSKSGQNFQFTFRSPMHAEVKGLEDLVIRTEPQVVRLKDVAEVRLEQPFEEVQSYYNGKPGIFIYLTESADAHIIKLQAEAAKLIEKSLAAWPKPLRYKLLFDNSQFMSEQVKSISNNGWVGVIIMLIFLGVVMGFRSAFAQLFSTPVIVASTLLVMFLTGQTINLICIMGMFIVLGIMVDDSVIVSDTYMQWRRKGYGPSEASARTARALMLPLITTFVAITASLLPVFFWSSTVSEFMKPIAIIFIAALGLSLLECLTLLPAHLQKLDQEFEKKTGLRERLWTRLEVFYAGFLQRFLQFRWIFTPLFLIGTLGSAFFAFQTLNFVDHIGYSGERLHFHYQLAEGQHQDLANILKDLPAPVVVGVQKTGIAERASKKLYGPSYGKFTLVVVASSDKIAPIKKEISEIMLGRLKQQPHLAWFEKEKANEVASSEDILRTPLYIAGDRIDQVLWAKDQLEKEIEKLPGFLRLEQPPEQYAEHWQFLPDEKRLSEAGLSVHDLTEQSSFALAPQFLGRIPFAGDLIDVRLRSQNYDEWGPDDLRQKKDQLQVQHPYHRGLIPLSRLGTWVKGSSQTWIMKRDGIPSVKLDASFDQTKIRRAELFKAFEQITQKLRKSEPLISIKTNEAQESQDEEMLTYAIELGLAGALVYVLVALTTGSYVRPVILLLGLLPIVGSVVLALYTHDRSISILVFIGLLSVLGISLNDGLIIVFKVKEGEQENGRLPAIMEAMTSKLRAVLITGTCAGISLIPVAYSTADVNLFVRPIAFGAMWGLFASVIQALFLLPSLLAMEADAHAWKETLVKAMGRLASKTEKSFQV